MGDKVYRKDGDKYIPIGYTDWNGFPSDGIWLVKFQNDHEKSASCISRLSDLPNPYPFYNMMLNRDEIATYLLRAFDDGPISMQEIADKFIKDVSNLNKPEILKFKHPNKPNLKK